MILYNQQKLSSRPTSDCVLKLPDQEDIDSLIEAMRLLPFENKATIRQGILKL